MTPPTFRGVFFYFKNHAFHSRVSRLITFCVRLTSYFGDKEVLWRDLYALAGLVDMPKWIVAKSIMVLGFEGSTKARTTLNSKHLIKPAFTKARKTLNSKHLITPSLTNSPLDVRTQVCVRSNHDRGGCCQRVCPFEHRCMFCGRADHGMCQQNKRGKRICTTSAKFEKERVAFEQKHFFLEDGEEALLKTLATPSVQKMSCSDPPSAPPPPLPIGCSLIVPSDSGLRSKAAPSVPGPLPRSPPPPPGLVRRLSPPPGLSAPASAVHVLGPPPFGPAPPFSSREVHSLPAPCKAAPATSGRVVAPCKAPPGCCLSAGLSAIVSLFQTCLRDAQVPEQCWGAAVDWVVQEQAVKVSEVLDNLQEIADVAGVRKLPLQRLKLRLLEESDV